ncbi:hypothetical protein [Thalassococcus sp. S3]|uniref:hypothetical protein n=1 Tax=Thalassococcus sp. S3 TaxID=2017482 RepID=UPI001C2C587F|nr:hypothetical protein [Thalassococcus sp. S3]
MPPYKLLERFHAYHRIDPAISGTFKCTRCGFDREPYWHIMRAVGPEYPRIA